MRTTVKVALIIAGFTAAVVIVMFAVAIVMAPR
jgi:hypothetical protein